MTDLFIYFLVLASVERAVDAYDLLWPVQRRVGGPGDDNGPRVVEIGREVDGAKDAPRSLTRAFIPACPTFTL
jgi:hypothetical protein